MSANAPLLLVVDDHEAARFGKVQFLRRSRYRVEEAGTGQEALAIAARQSPDVVVLDVNLPDISGLEVCRTLKAGDAKPAAQVLQLSSTAISDEDIVRGLTGGADAYLTEPVHPSVLLATIQALVRVRRAEQALADALTRERSAREEAERANRFKDEFLATLSHELRTPLNSMVGWIWQLRHGGLDESMERRALDRIERSTEIQLRLINDLLDVSRIGKGKIDLVFEVVDLATVVEATIDSLQGALKGRHLQVAVRLVPTRVRGDASRLQQVVGNLLTNAIKFSEQGGTIEVQLEATAGDAVLTVRDAGEGLDPLLLPHVFDQFWQADRGPARRHGGLGLGLTIVRKLVELHGGSVHAESAGPGQGATFIVRLPLMA
jgi:signal transduction histidine kinase